jgi:hypothetical protein
MAAAIRAHDRTHLVTVGMLPHTEAPFAQPAVVSELDFVSVHVYPKAGEVAESIALVEEFAALGKPVLVEETFPLHCTDAELERFMLDTRASVAGFIGFYWGEEPDELDSPEDILTMAWLDVFQRNRGRILSPAQN